jgi:hypothetical protein
VEENLGIIRTNKIMPFPLINKMDAASNTGVVDPPVRIIVYADTCQQRYLFHPHNLDIRQRQSLAPIGKAKTQLAGGHDDLHGSHAQEDGEDENQRCEKPSSFLRGDSMVIITIITIMKTMRRVNHFPII